MRRRLLAWALAVSICFAAAVPVSSADAEPGFYNVGAAPGVTVEALDAAGPVRPVERNVDGCWGAESFCPGSDRLRITVSGTKPGRMYLVTVSDPDTGKVYYVNQKYAARTAVFEASFPLPGDRADLVVSVGSSDADWAKREVPLSWTPAENGTSCPGGGDCPMARYSDLRAGTWYHDGIHWALEEGVMNGVSETKFSPDASLSRAMLVTVLWRLEASPAAGECAFPDVAPGRFYSEAVSWAAAEGIVTGYRPEAFGPEDPVTREQLALILYRYLAWKGTDPSAGITDRLGEYIDTERISPWALEAMRWAVYAGVVRGTDGQTLSPRAGATRAQAAAMLLRACGMPPG